MTIIWKKSSLKRLTKSSSTSAPGRSGRILTNHRSTSFFAKKLRIMNYKPFLVRSDVAQVLRIEREPSRSAFIGLCRFLKSGILSYLPIVDTTKPGDLIYINPPASQITNTGTVAFNNRQFKIIAPLYRIPKGTLINHIAVKKLGKFTLCRSAGAKAKLLSFSANKKLAAVLMPSGKIIYLNSSCYCVTGANSNPSHFLGKLVKAGQNRHAGIRPTVRGVAMNPVDHPMGGGEGKSSGGRPSVSPWGKLTKGGYRTVSSSTKAKTVAIKKIFNRV